MDRRALSLRPCPERSLLAAEAEAERIASLPPNPFTLATQALEHLESHKGKEAAVAHVEAWLRTRKPRKAKRPITGKIVYLRRAHALFPEGSNG